MCVVIIICFTLINATVLAGFALSAGCNAILLLNFDEDYNYSQKRQWYIISKEDFVNSML